MFVSQLSDHLPINNAGRIISPIITQKENLFFSDLSFGDIHTNRQNSYIIRFHDIINYEKSADDKIWIEKGQQKGQRYI